MRLNAGDEARFLKASKKTFSRAFFGRADLCLKKKKKLTIFGFSVLHLPKKGTKILDLAKEGTGSRKIFKQGCCKSVRRSKGVVEKKGELKLHKSKIVRDLEKIKKTTVGKKV